MQVIKLINKTNSVLVLILKHLAIWILTAMMLLTAVDVCLRYVFNRPITGSFELVEFMMALVVPFSIVFCASEKGHVQVDIVVEHFNKKIRAFFEFTGNIISLFLFVLITWQTFIYIAEEYKSGLTSAVLYIPLYPFIGAMAAAFVILCFLLLAELLNYLAGTKSKWNQSQ